MVATPKVTNPTVLCFSCMKAFCLEDAKSSAFRVLLCPYCGKSLIRSKATLVRLFFYRYRITLTVLASGICFSCLTNMGVTFPDRVLSAPQAFASKPFEFRYVDLANTQIVSEDPDNTVVRFDLSIQGRAFSAYGMVSKTFFQKVKQEQRLYSVKGNYDGKSNRYVLSDLTISYGWWGYLVAVPYQVTSLIFNPQVAVMTADFSIWFIGSVILTLITMSFSEEGKELVGIGLDALS